MRTERTGRPSRCAPSGGRPDKQREAPSVQCEPTVRVASPGRRPGEHRSPYGQREPLWRAIAEAAAGLFPSPEQTPR
ncbi:Protein of unknown function [Gryllus bimaculatus]|nr:Protein of unknown function [Gryllus bimaculatus]